MESDWTENKIQSGIQARVESLRQGQLGSIAGIPQESKGRQALKAILSQTPVNDPEIQRLALEELDEINRQRVARGLGEIDPATNLGSKLLINELFTEETQEYEGDLDQKEPQSNTSSRNWGGIVGRVSGLGSKAGRTISKVSQQAGHKTQEGASSVAGGVSGLATKVAYGGYPTQAEVVEMRLNQTSKQTIIPEATADYLRKVYLEGGEKNQLMEQAGNSELKILNKKRINAGYEPIDPSTPEGRIYLKNYLDGLPLYDEKTLQLPEVDGIAKIAYSNYERNYTGPRNYIGPKDRIGQLPSDVQAEFRTMSQEYALARARELGYIDQNGKLTKPPETKEAKDFEGETTESVLRNLDRQYTGKRGPNGELPASVKALYQKQAEEYALSKAKELGYITDPSENIPDVLTAEDFSQLDQRITELYEKAVKSGDQEALKKFHQLDSVMPIDPRQPGLQLLALARGTKTPDREDRRKYVIITRKLKELYGTSVVKPKPKADEQASGSQATYQAGEGEPAAASVIEARANVQVDSATRGESEPAITTSEGNSLAENMEADKNYQDLLTQAEEELRVLDPSLDLNSNRFLIELNAQREFRNKFPKLAEAYDKKMQAEAVTTERLPLVNAEGFDNLGIEKDIFSDPRFQEIIDELIASKTTPSDNRLFREAAFKLFNERYPDDAKRYMDEYTKAYENPEDDPAIKVTRRKINDDPAGEPFKWNVFIDLYPEKAKAYADKIPELKEALAKQTTNLQPPSAPAANLGPGAATAAPPITVAPDTENPDTTPAVAGPDAAVQVPPVAGPEAAAAPVAPEAALSQAQIMENTRAKVEALANQPFNAETQAQLLEVMDQLQKLLKELNKKKEENPNDREVSENSLNLLSIMFGLLFYMLKSMATTSLSTSQNS